VLCVITASVLGDAKKLFAYSEDFYKEDVEHKVTSAEKKNA